VPPLQPARPSPWARGERSLAPMNMSATDDWRRVLAAIEQRHAQLCAATEALRVALARPTTGGDGDVTGLQWRPDVLWEPERVALYESVCAAQQVLEGLTEQLQQLSDLLEDGGSTISP
jgi:hypothetical protein